MFTFLFTVRISFTVFRFRHIRSECLKIVALMIVGHKCRLKTPTLYSYAILIHLRLRLDTHYVAMFCNHHIQSSLQHPFKKNKKLYFIFRKYCHMTLGEDILYFTAQVYNLDK